MQDQTAQNKKNSTCRTSNDVYVLLFCTCEEEEINKGKRGQANDHIRVVILFLVLESVHFFVALALLRCDPGELPDLYRMQVRNVLRTP